MLPGISLALAGLALAPQDFGNGDEYPTLLPGEPARALISTLHDEYPTWRIDVPAGATAMRIWTTGATDDLDLYLSSEYASDPDLDYSDLAGPGIWLDEELLVTVADSVPLYECAWFVTLSPGVASLEPDRLSSIRAELHVEFLEPVRATLVPDEVLELTVTRRHGLRAILDLPEDFEPERRSTWRVELFCPNADTDLLVGPRPTASALAYPNATSSRTIGYEQVTFRGRQAKAIELHAYGLPEYDYLESLDLRLRLTEVVEGQLPTSLVPPLELPAFGSDARARALAGTVAVFGNMGSGTGTILSEAGLLVTNAHVVASPQAQASLSALPGRFSRALFAGFNDDPRLPATPDVSLELLDYREDLDLALLAISGTLDERPLPEGLRFPALELGSSAALQLGDELLALGYPMTGGDSSMTTISVTRGICSGFAESLEGPSIKTDAGVHSGVSGGALLDVAWRLVGVPSASITDANMAGGLGFAVPVESFPASWLELAARADLDALRRTLTGAGGPHLPLAAPGMDRIAWALAQQDVARFATAEAGAVETSALVARILAREHVSVPALLNVLAELDTPSEAAAAARCAGLLERLTHSEDLGWGADAESNQGLLEQLSSEWTQVSATPELWIELARLDRPEQQPELARFRGLLKAQHHGPGAPR